MVSTELSSPVAGSKPASFVFGLTVGGDVTGMKISDSHVGLTVGVSLTGTESAGSCLFLGCDDGCKLLSTAGG